MLCKRCKIPMSSGVAFIPYTPRREKPVCALPEYAFGEVTKCHECGYTVDTIREALLVKRVKELEDYIELIICG